MAVKKADVYDGSENWNEFQNTDFVKALHDPEKGIYYVQGSLGDQWEVKEDKFHASYRPVTPNKA